MANSKIDSGLRKRIEESAKNGRFCEMYEEIDKLSADQKIEVQEIVHKTMAKKGGIKNE